MTKIVHVAVGVIKLENKFFLTKRLMDSHQGGLWEFPGGKVEKNETVHQALHRELKEEVSIDTLSCTSLMQISHDYGDKKVFLVIICCQLIFNCFIKISVLRFVILVQRKTYYAGEIRLLVHRAFLRSNQQHLEQVD